MKTTCWISAVVLAASCAFLGCTFDDAPTEDDENIAETEGALIFTNALTPNALTPNALTPNALTPNALTPNALNPNAMAASAKAALEDPTATGEVSRVLLKYMIGCALDNTQSYSFTWYDAAGAAHNEVYQGYLGLAKDWPTKSLSPSEQEWISACLLSRVNWYGTSVMLSARAQHTNLHVTDVAEGQEFSTFEGAFWGNLFDATPTAFACNHAANAAQARAALRDCAVGHMNADGTVSSCGIITIVGDCGSHCSNPDASDGYYPSCGLTLSGPNKTHRVISTFIP